MSMLAASRQLDRLSLASRQQVALRAVPLVATPSFVWVTVVLGSPFHPVLTTGLMLLALGTALLPDSSLPLFLVLALATTWALQVPETLSWWTPLAALLLLATHLACTLCGYGPPALTLDGRVLVAWAARSLAMVSATALVWLGTVLLAALDLPAGSAPLVAGLVAALGWTAYLGRRLLTR